MGVGFRTLLVLSLTAVGTLSSSMASPLVRFSNSHGDDMVLQHGGRGANVWGFAPAGSEVTLTLGTAAAGVVASVHTHAAADGTWSVTLPPQPPSLDEHTVEIVGGATLTGVLFGDVWVCSGQSNMDHPMTSIINASHEIARANSFSGTVRLLKVAHVASYDPERELAELPGLETRWARANNLTVANFSATCFLTGAELQLNRAYPVGLIDSSWAGVSITALSSMASCGRCGLDARAGCPGGNPYFPGNATSVYNTMVAPLHRTTVFGVLWWQGENSATGCPAEVIPVTMTTNTSEAVANPSAATYYCLWQSLIQDWRVRWHTRSGASPQLPFGFVQLEPSANPAIRWDEVAHRVSVPNSCLPGVFMAAALDFGDTVAGVHTRYKRPIAERLARAARAIAYNQTIEYSGPVATSAAVSGDTVVLQFAGAGSAGVELRGDGGFSVCPVEHAAQCYKWANDKNFFNVSARPGATAHEVLLSIPDAVAGLGGVGVVRYEWAALPCNWPALKMCAVYSKDAGLPAPPFMLPVGNASAVALQPPPCIDHAALEHGPPASRPLAQRRFVHPGVFLGATQLAHMRAQVNITGSPFQEALAKLEKFTWLNAQNHTSMSLGWNGTISCGYFDSHDYGCRNETSDSTTVWVQAMLWAATGDPKWANRAVTIMNFYSAHLKGYNLDGNGKLEAAWAADKWARSAELLASTGAPWAASDIESFREMLTTKSVPVLYNGSCFNGNWELAMIEGLSSIAVFTENATLWDHAIGMWRERVPAYFYRAEADGPAPQAVAHCGGKAYWYGQLVFNSSVNGVSQETCRDFGHLSYGLASTFNVAETALIQGVDLYTANADRLRGALEFHTGLLNGGGYPPSGSPYKPGARNVTNPLVCNGTQLKLSYAPTYQVGLTGMARLYGSTKSLPNTARYVQQWVWNLSASDACGHFMYCDEELTHATPAP